MSITRGNLTRGRILRSLIIYSIPMIITNVIQTLFHSADIFILSVMTGDAEVAAVSACGPIISFLLCTFTGFAVGSDVLVAKKFGKGDEQGVQRGVGTSVVVGLSSGVLLAVVTFICARLFLIMSQCQSDVLDAATEYLRVYALGMPFIMLYNFTAAVLRAQGDSVRPMVYMLVSGVLNIGLNITFVGLAGLTVKGVAMATALSNLVALILAVAALLRGKGICKVRMRHMRIFATELGEIVRIGVPTCLCGAFFYISNVVISAQVNTISTDAMTANGIAGQFDGIVYNVGYSIALACSVMVGQNFGAKRMDRIKRTVFAGLLYATVASIAVGGVMAILSKPLLGLMTESEEVIALARGRMLLLCMTYFITSIMEVFSFSLRPLGRQKSTMVVGGICGLGIRSSWALLVWPMNKTMGMLFASFAVSALVATIIYIFVYAAAVKKWDKIFEA